jgi:hypothetical protein
MIRQFFGAIGQGCSRRALRRKIFRWIMTAAMWLAIHCEPVVPSAQARHREDSRDHYHIVLHEQKNRLSERKMLAYVVNQCIRRRHDTSIHIQQHLNQYLSSNCRGTEVATGASVDTRFDRMLLDLRGFENSMLPLLTLAASRYNLKKTKHHRNRIKFWIE